MDRHALEAMKRDVSGWMASDQRYVSVLLTQLGHAPWPDRPESRSIKEHGKLVAKIQDSWLGELVEPPQCHAGVVGVDLNVDDLRGTRDAVAM